MEKIKIEIGDYSRDGHGISETVELFCNRNVKQLEDLYKKSCVLTGLQFTTNGDLSGRDRDWQEMDKWKVLQDYQQDTITDFQIEEFKKHGIIISEPCFGWETDRFTELFLQFLKLSDGNLQWVFVTKENKEETLQLFIGYGIYDN